MKQNPQLMPKIKKKWDLISKGKRDFLIREIITHFRKERNQEIGILSAEELLDFFLESLTGEIYNRAITDAKAQIKQSFEDIEINLDQLINK